MKKIRLFILLCMCCSGLFAHIDRPIDGLIYEGKTYDAYSQPLAEYVKNDRMLKRALSTNPVNPRLPKHYYATFEIKGDKLYLNKVELIVISERSMRFWRIPLRVDYKLEAVEASKLFGKGAEYPIFCDWYSGKIFSTIFDGDRTRKYLFSENTAFEIEKGVLVKKLDLNTRTILTECVSFEEANLIPKIFENKDFGADNRLFDLRCIIDLNLLSAGEFSLLRNAQPFKTRAYLRLDEKNRPYLCIPKTRKTPMQSLALFKYGNHDLSEFKSGDRVEASIFLDPNNYKRVGLLGLSHLGGDELMHSPDFFLRLN